jgi:hypothetical protein
MVTFPLLLLPLLAGGLLRLPLKSIGPLALCVISLSCCCCCPVGAAADSSAFVITMSLLPPLLPAGLFTLPR